MAGRNSVSKRNEYYKYMVILWGLCNEKKFQLYCKRRDSLKNPHVREELRNLVPQDVFKGSFADFNLSNMTRLSGSSARGSLQLGKTSVIHKATPSLRTTAINASAAACSQSRAGSKPRESKVPSASRLPRSQSVSHKSAIPPVKSNLQKPTAGR